MGGDLSVQRGLAQGMEYVKEAAATKDDKRINLLLVKAKEVYGAFKALENDFSRDQSAIHSLAELGYRIAVLENAPNLIKRTGAFPQKSDAARALAVLKDEKSSITDRMDAIFSAKTASDKFTLQGWALRNIQWLSQGTWSTNQSTGSF